MTNQHPHDGHPKHAERFPQRAGVLLAITLQKIGSQIDVSVRYVPTYMTTNKESKGLVRTLVPAYPELYSEQKILKGHLGEAQAFVNKVLGSDLMIPSQELNQVFTHGCAR